MNCVLIQEPHFVLSFSHLGSSMALSREGMQSRSEPKNIYITTEEQSSDGNYCVGFFKGMRLHEKCMRLPQGGTRLNSVLLLPPPPSRAAEMELSRTYSSCPVLRDGGICQTMLLRSGLKMVSVQLCSCNAETHLSSSCILEGSIRI